MRTFNKDLSKALLAGMAPYSKMPTGSLFLDAAENVRLSDMGAEPPEFSVDVKTGAVNWIQGRATRTGAQAIVAGVLSSVNTTTGATAALPLVSAINGSAVVGGIFSGPAQFAGSDLGWGVASNGAMALRTDGENVYGTAGSFRALAYHRGRMVAGGFSATPFGGLSELLTLGQAVGGITATGQWDSIVLWSSIGGGDFPAWAYAYLRSTATAEDKLAMIRRNQFGFIFLPEIGVVNGLVALENILVVTGSEGVAILQYATDVYGVMVIKREPMTGACGAVHGLGAVVERTDGSLFFISEKGAMQKLGFSFALLGAGPTYMQEGRQLGEIYFSRGLRLYTLRLSEKLLQLSYVSSSSPFWYYDEAGIETHFGLSLSRAPRIRVAEFDVGVPGSHTLTEVIIGPVGVNTNLYARAYGYINGAWRGSQLILVNKEGIANLRIQGTKFRVEILGTEGAAFNIYQLSANFQISDKRALHTAYGNQTNG